MREAFSEGVNPGGLYTAQEIKILICYMLLNVAEPLPETAVTDVLYGGGMANFFEVSAAIQELLQIGHLKEEDGCLSLSDTGAQIGSTLANMIPFTLRERSVEAALRLLARQKRQRDTTVTIEKMEVGRLVRCRVQEADAPLMEVTLRVGDDMQANLVKERFLDDPTLLYRAMIAALTGGVRSTCEDTRLIIDFR